MADTPGVSQAIFSPFTSIQDASIHAVEVLDEDGNVVAYDIDGLPRVPKAQADELAQFIAYRTGPNVGVNVG